MQPLPFRQQWIVCIDQKGVVEGENAEWSTLREDSGVARMSEA